MCVCVCVWVGVCDAVHLIPTSLQQSFNYNFSENMDKANTVVPVLCDHSSGNPKRSYKGGRS